MIRITISAEDGQVLDSFLVLPQFRGVLSTPLDSAELAQKVREAMDSRFITQPISQG